MHPKKKRFCPKTDFLGIQIFQFQLTKQFLVKSFFGALFTKIKFKLLKSVWKDGFFYTEFAIFEEKSFHLLEGTQWILLRNRWIFRKTVFYKQPLDFHSPFKILCHITDRNHELMSKSGTQVIPRPQHWEKGKPLCTKERLEITGQWATGSLWVTRSSERGGEGGAENERENKLVQVKGGIACCYICRQVLLLPAQLQGRGRIQTSNTSL